MNSNISFLFNFFYFFCLSPGVTDCWLNWGSIVRYYYGNLYYYTPKRWVTQHHPYHILIASPWPFLVALSLLVFVCGVVNFLTAADFWGVSLLFGFTLLVAVVWFWWIDVVRESLSQHTKEIKVGIGIGMVLFIVSEVMFFFSFFWAFFHFSLAPGIELGCVWPPVGLEELVIKPFGIPLFNTVVLVVSGLTVTCVHHAFVTYSVLQQRIFNILTLIGEHLHVSAALQMTRVMIAVRFGICEWRLLTAGNEYVGARLVTLTDRFMDTVYVGLIKPILGFKGAWGYVVVYFLFTLGLAILFTFSQGLEYVNSAISISDGVYGSTFFMMTGFHGFHVIVGTIFLFVSFIRILRQKVSFVRTVGLECAIWYWHFVDVVWLFLFVFVYVWGNGFINNVSLETIASADFAAKWQVGFQDSACVVMESIVDLHDYILFYLLIVVGLVFWLLLSLIFFGPTGSINSIKNYNNLTTTRPEGFRSRFIYTFKVDPEPYLNKIQTLLNKFKRQISALKYRWNSIVSLIRKGHTLEVNNVAEMKGCRTAHLLRIDFSDPAKGNFSVVHTKNRLIFGLIFGLRNADRLRRLAVILKIVKKKLLRLGGR